MNRFLSTKNIYTVAILWFIVISMIVLLAIGLEKEHLSTLPIVLLSLVIALIVWILLDTRYVIKQHFLLYRSGPFRGRIDIEKIQKIKYFSGLHVPVTMKPALDTKGFIITYDQYEDVYVSPDKSDVFLNELLKINPNIEVTN
ncbi:PH domain-containing protein [Flavobacterium sp.]|uniref:PH domain-containing protein n=1 Tax=Flavobacterium sp. TaxID=239 RepID=UPI0026164CFD|nr:PH domain-containing protein [Flavobacterium sp.]